MVEDKFSIFGVPACGSKRNLASDGPISSANEPGSSSHSYLRYAVEERVASHADGVKVRFADDVDSMRKKTLQPNHESRDARSDSRPYESRQVPRISTSSQVNRVPIYRHILEKPR